MRILRRGTALALLVGLVAGLVTVTGARPAAACSCVGWTDTEAVDAADVVFVGSVLSVSPRERSSRGRPGRRVYTIRVDEPLKGRPRSRERVRTPVDSAACGVELAPGSDVLVFATGDGGGPVRSGRGELATTLCAGTRPLDGAVPDEVRAAARGAPVDCAAAIDAVDVLPPGYREIGGVVALPTDRTLALDPAGAAPHFAKVGLAVRSGASATITVGRDRRGPVAVQWGGTRPASVVRVDGCVAPGGEQWVVFPGGYWVDRPTCVRTAVRGTSTEQRRVPVGRACAAR